MEILEGDGKCYLCLNILPLAYVPQFARRGAKIEAVNILGISSEMSHDGAELMPFRALAPISC